jgi:hypothetical protein
MDFNLDISWFNDLTKDIQCNKIKEKESMSNIHISFIYVNLNNEIHKIVNEKHDLEYDTESEPSDSSDKSVEITEDGNFGSRLSLMKDPFLSKDYLFSLVSSKIKLEKIDYKVLDVLLFNIDLDNSELSYISSYLFSRNVSYLDDIIIPKSLPIFHSTNTLYFILQQKTYPKKPSLIIDNLQSDNFEDIVNVKIQTRKRRNLVKYTRKRRVVSQLS